MLKVVIVTSQNPGGTNKRLKLQKNPELNHVLSMQQTSHFYTKTRTKPADKGQTKFGFSQVLHCPRTLPDSPSPALGILGVVVHYLCDCRDWPCFTRPSCTPAFSSIGEGNRKNYKSLRTTDSSSATPCKHWLLRANATSTPQRPPQTHADDATEKIRFWTDILCATLLWALETGAKPGLNQDWNYQIWFETIIFSWYSIVLYSYNVIVWIKSNQGLQKV